ncbi:Metal tolerance protein 2 [Acorus calamus]|uniref:Metal tolerance protein 2 n=1 Tax=Acorus calamus TaxID=4465 RepID=A0AAV9FIQ1_ACOCL|nr:Metal tolerance protein 2 [Acorus calamus]
MPGWWMLPFVEVDVKKIVSRVIERARELCISKSFESLGALGISGVLLLTSGGIAWHAIDVLKSFIMSAGGINLGLKFLDSLAGIIISGMILKAGLEIAYQRLMIRPTHFNPPMFLSIGDTAKNDCLTPK